MARRLLILGGTAEARQLAARLSLMPGYEPLLSLAGRTSVPAAQPLPTRSGGFGGAAGLADFIRAEAIEALVVATHPFAARIAENAVEASSLAGIPAVRLIRPAWQAAAGDDWRFFPDLGSLVDAIGAAPRRVFATIGRQDAHRFASAPQHHYVIRSIDPVDPPLSLPDAIFIEARGPFGLEAEIALMRRHAIEVLVTKNSGGDDTRAKLNAARRLGIPVMLVARPAPTSLAEVATIDDVLRFLAHHAPPAERGE